MKTLRLFTIMVGVLLLAAMPALADVTVLWWPGAGEATGMQNMIDEYNATQGKADGNQVNVIFYSRQGFWDKMLTDLAAGSTNFDLNLTTTYSLGKYAPYLTPIDEFLPEDVNETFSPAALSTLNYEGKQYGIPTDLSLHFTYYRKDLIEKLLSDEAWQKKYAEISEKHLGKKLTPKDPADWTWDDYMATALFFSKSTNPDSPTRFGTALQLKNLLYNIMLWQATFVSQGGDLMTEDYTPTIDTPAMRQALNIYKVLYDKKATPPGSINYEYGESNAAFGSGQTATMLQWNAAFAELSDAEKYPQIAEKFGIAPLPAGSEGHKTHMHSLGLALNAASKNKEDAAKFLKFVATQKAMEIYARNGGIPPAPPVLAKLADVRIDFPALGEYSAKYGFVVTGGTAAFAVPIYDLLAEKFSAYWAGQLSIDEAISQASEGMAKIIKNTK